MHEIDRRMALLRLMLADITAREAQSRTNEQQLRAQHRRIIDFAVQRNAGVGNALAALAENEARLAEETLTLRHLEELRRRAQSELEALLLMRSVSDAQQRLAELEARRQELTRPSEASAAPLEASQSHEVAEIDAEMAELRTLIEDASASAARALAEQQAERAP